MKKTLAEVKEEINKLLTENNCVIMSLHDVSDEQDYSYLVRKVSETQTEQLNLET